ncbi:hypothetical protein [Streptomyces sp. IpFD-1.1]|uniref:hypothetical protein n=1 Tax=Streptomyces sp. IpFD-1.1 TaxID=2841664 RepID=UPI002095879E|nr:hypothetical protein [Streptomyces sp. IpFD-1.1]
MFVINAVTRRYVDRCAEAESPLRNAARKLSLPAVYSQSFGQVLLDRPLFADRTETEEFADDLRSLFTLMTSLPARLYGGDLRAYCAAIGMDDRLAELMCRGSVQPPVLHARADAYHDGTRFHLLELNAGSELGGTDTAQQNRAWLRVPEFAAFAEEHGLRHLDTTPRVAAALRRAAEPVTGGEPVVALIESTGGLAAHEHVFTAVREAMAAEGITLLLGEIHELAERNGKITLRGTPLDVILRYFVAGELLDDPTGQQVLDTLIRADREGRTALFLPLDSGVYASKGSLALLHDPAVRAELTEAERATVDRAVPWTRLLDEGRQYAGDRAGLLARCRAEREELVLKPGVGYGGVGTVIGHETDDARWAEALERAAGGDAVVQRRVRPAPEPVVDAATGRTEEWAANWGVFVDGEGYAGGFVRALRPGHGAVISFSNPGTRSSCVFTAD